MSAFKHHYGIYSLPPCQRAGARALQARKLEYIKPACAESRPIRSKTSITFYNCLHSSNYTKIFICTSHDRLKRFIKSIRKLVPYTAREIEPYRCRLGTGALSSVDFMQGTGLGRILGILTGNKQLGVQPAIDFLSNSPPEPALFCIPWAYVGLCSRASVPLLPAGRCPMWARTGEELGHS